MNGVLVVDKPVGPTSHDVVARVRRAIGTRRVGHTGTLDPLASGVLALVVGRATRLSPLLSGGRKVYEARVRLGASTETYDAEGRVTRDPDTGVKRPLDPPAPPPGITAADLEALIPEFTGQQTQSPPPFSAKKLEGVPAYKLARRKVDVAPRPVSVTVFDLALVHFEAGLATFRLECSAGYYVRSFAHGLGERLGCGAYLEGLRRTRSGQFTLEEALPLEEVEADGAAAAARLIPLEQLLPELPAVRLGDRGVRRAAHGNALGPGDVAPGQKWVPGDGAHVRLLDPSGRLLGIARPGAGGVLHPRIVLM